MPEATMRQPAPECGRQAPGRAGGHPEPPTGLAQAPPRRLTCILADGLDAAEARHDAGSPAPARELHKSPSSSLDRSTAAPLRNRPRCARSTPVSTRTKKPWFQPTPACSTCSALGGASRCPLSSLSLCGWHAIAVVASIICPRRRSIQEQLPVAAAAAARRQAGARARASRLQGRGCVQGSRAEQGRQS